MQISWVIAQSRSQQLSKSSWGASALAGTLRARGLAEAIALGGAGRPDAGTTNLAKTGG